jgi:hypothetical protein
MKDEAVFSLILAAAAGLILSRRQAAAAASYAAPASAPIGDREAPRIMNAAIAAADAFALAFAPDEVTTGTSSSVTDPGFPAAIFASLAPVFNQVMTSDRTGIPADARRVLELIGHAEAPQGYNQIYSKIPASLYPPTLITKMRVRDVIAWQASIRSRVASTASGRYQVIYQTLKEIAAQLGVMDALFDAATQDRIGFALMRRRGWDAFAGGRSSWTDFANKLAMEWAALPVVQGANAGRSYYDGDGLNASRVSVQAVRAVLGGSVAV